MGASLDIIAKETSRFIAKPTPKDFGALALKVFAFQFKRNLPYRHYCLRQGKSPDTVSHWNEIPAVPTGTFKEVDLSCIPKGEPPEAIFLTSGTTQGQQKPGRHLVPKLSVYEASVLSNFETHLLADLPASGKRLRMMILTGSPLLWPHSSLTYMMEVVRKSYGAPDSAYYIKEDGLDVETLLKELECAERTEEPVFLLGITLAFYELLERIQNRRIRFHLPPGSRMMDTGGFKNRQTEIEKGALYARYQEALGIPQHFIINEYGMTEMGSQFYDNVLINHFSRRDQKRFKTIPPWVRTAVVDPETLCEVPHGSVGMLKHFDLANCGSVMAILTEDLGRRVDDGFELAGRIQGAEPRGCSLLIEEFRRRS